ncbi:MAG: beta-lactamase family protein [Aequorivita sp.]|nr:beta-lactamase family protein [Aequorivita sp.]
MIATKYILGAFLFCCSINLNAQQLNKVILDSIISQSQRTNSNALIIYKDGNIAYENYFNNAVQKIEAMSATKSVVAIGIGILLDKGFIDSLNQPVYTIYPEWKQGNKKFITIRHLLEHTSGLQNVPNAGDEVEIAPDVIQLALCAELDDKPGTRYSYNNKSSNLLAGIIEKTAKLKMDAFLDKYLFKDLGIKNFSWRKDEKGNPYGMAGLQIYPKDFAKIGLLILDNGNWNGKQLISAAWIKEMLKPSPNNQNYGYEWWLTYENMYYSFDDELINAIKNETDETTFQLIAKLKGRYKGMKDLREFAQKIYSPEELKLVGKIMQKVQPSQMKTVNDGEILNYTASGYLGQYLIIVPKSKTVVVRMITSDNFKKIPNNSTMENLRKLVNEL